MSLHTYICVVFVIYGLACLFCPFDVPQLSTTSASSTQSADAVSVSSLSQGEPNTKPGALGDEREREGGRCRGVKGRRGREV